MWMPPFKCGSKSEGMNYFQTETLLCWLARQFCAKQHVNKLQAEIDELLAMIEKCEPARKQIAWLCFKGGAFHTELAQKLIRLRCQHR